MPGRKNHIPPWRRLPGAQEGVALVEMALLTPILLLMFYGTVELSRFIQINHKIEKATFQMADVVAQSSTISATTLDQLTSAMEEVLEPFAFDGRARIFISSVSPQGASLTPRLRWQYCKGGISAASQFGARGETADLPDGFALEEKEDIVVTEMFYDYRPILTQGLLPAQRIYHYAIFRPRLGALDSFSVSCGS